MDKDIQTQPKQWHDTAWGKIFIGVIIGLILIFAGYLINTHILNSAKQQQQWPVKSTTTDSRKIP